MRYLIMCLMLAGLLAPLPCQAAEDALSNIESPSLPSTLSPGAVILLPDGGQSVILSALPNGDLLTDLGLVISPEGLVRDGEFKGRTVRLDPELLPPASPDVAVLPRTKKPGGVTPAKTTPPRQPSPAPEMVQEKPRIQTELPKTVNPPKKLSPEEEKALTLAQMLPLTRIEEEKKGAAPKPQEKANVQKPGPAEEKKKTQKAPAKEPEGRQAQKAPAKEPEPGKAQKAEARPKAAKQKTGEPLRIPPEAVKTGNLSFLEGCWQGTRPEYFSKRIIKECFCFGANGGSGKRRIFDGPKRMCIGASKAHLSSNGVLSVTSNGAACNDGERWGSAEMICRNSGPRTPCSWVFTDANNGRQSYEIPFVRVESCGR